MSQKSQETNLDSQGLIKWAGATAVAAVVFLSYIHGFIFTRSEADTLIKRVDTLEERILHRLDRIDQKLEEIRKSK